MIARYGDARARPRRVSATLVFGAQSVPGKLQGFGAGFFLFRYAWICQSLVAVVDWCRRLEESWMSCLFCRWWFAL
uniref:Uncharacterized protein n=1 Tax=Parascaris equorum TaxID=6256 RepID=A0A914RNG1_PAREQ